MKLSPLSWCQKNFTNSSLATIDKWLQQQQSHCCLHWKLHFSVINWLLCDKEGHCCPKHHLNLSNCKWERHCVQRHGNLAEKCYLKIYLESHHDIEISYYWVGWDQWTISTLLATTILLPSLDTRKLRLSAINRLLQDREGCPRGQFWLKYHSTLKIWSNWSREDLCVLHHDQQPQQPKHWIPIRDLLLWYDFEHRDYYG